MSDKTKLDTFFSTEDIKDNLRLKSVRGALFSAISGGGDLILRILSAIILARLLIPEYFGLIGMVTAITGITEQISALGLSTATVQAKKITHQQCSKLFWINTSAGFLFTLLISCLSPIIAKFYNDPRLIVISIAVSTNFLWAGLTVQHEALLNRQMKQPRVAFNRFTASLLGTIVAIILALNGAGYWALVAREVSRGFIVFIGVWFYCRWLPGINFKGAKIGDLIRFGRDITLTQFIISIISK